MKQHSKCCTYQEQVWHDFDIFEDEFFRFSFIMSDVLSYSFFSSRIYTTDAADDTIGFRCWTVDFRLDGLYRIWKEFLRWHFLIRMIEMKFFSLIRNASHQFQINRSFADQNYVFLEHQIAIGGWQWYIEILLLGQIIQSQCWFLEFHRGLTSVYEHILIQFMNKFWCYYSSV